MVADEKVFSQNILTCAQNVPNELILDYKSVEQFAVNEDTSKNNLQEMEKIVRIITRCDYEKEELEGLKYMLLYTALVEKNSGDNADVYKALLSANRMVFKPIIRKDNNCSIVNTVDMIIAEAMRCLNAGRVESIDDDLKQFLNETCKYRNVQKSQYDILVQAFSQIGAYAEEKMVLQAMVDNMIERTPIQEKRLGFLQQHRFSSIIDDTENATIKEKKKGEIIYEYRTLSWNDNEIEDYFANLSLKNETLVAPCVIFEWRKMVSSTRLWNVEEIKDRIICVLEENFESRFSINVMRTAINSDWIEYDDTIVITEADLNVGYPWIAFNLTGQNFSKRQISITVNAWYWVAGDEQVLHADAFDQNKNMAQKIKALKNHQNPKWDTHIEGVVDIIISEIQNWFNDKQSDSIYG